MTALLLLVVVVGIGLVAGAVYAGFKGTFRAKPEDRAPRAAESAPGEAASVHTVDGRGIVAFLREIEGKEPSATTIEEHTGSEEASGSATVVPESPRTSISTRTFDREVVVIDVRMPFGSMVMFMVKWAIAAIPAFIILSLIAALIVAVLGGVVGGITRGVSRY